MIWCARKRFSPSSSAKKRSRPSRSRSSRLVFGTSVITGSAGADFRGGEEVGDFDRGVLQAVGTMHGVGVDRFGEIGADGARGGVLRVGGAHQLAVLQHGVLAFQH